MTDDAFLAAFENGSLDPATFNHAAHLRAAWCYLQRLPFLEACIAKRNALTAFAGRVGKAGLYHETITVAFMSLMAERMATRPDIGWRALLACCPELSQRDLLGAYYRAEQLDSPLARRQLVLLRAQYGAAQESQA
jgi:hypothetical protein